MSINVTRKSMVVDFCSNYSFGSGSYDLSVWIDGERVTAAWAEAHGYQTHERKEGCHTVVSVSIPLDLVKGMSFRFRGASAPPHARWDYTISGRKLLWEELGVSSWSPKGPSLAERLRVRKSILSNARLKELLRGAHKYGGASAPLHCYVNVAGRSVRFEYNDFSSAWRGSDGSYVY
jgi:hypothetical protein